jgi:hypothetical protein
MRKLIIISKKKKLNPRQKTKKENKATYDLSKLNHYKIFFGAARNGFVVLSEEMAFVNRWILLPYKQRGYSIRYIKSINKNKRRRIRYRQVMRQGKTVIQIHIVKLNAAPINIKDINIPYILY